MRFTVEAKELAAALTLPAKIANPKGPIETLRHVRVSIATEKSTSLHIEASDLESGCRVACPCAVEAEGELCLPARELLCVAKSQRGTLVFAFDGKHMVVTSSRGEFVFNSPPAEDFPAWATADLDAREVDADAFAQAFRFCLPACGREEIRFYLEGVHVEPHATGLRMEATDGHRFHAVDMHNQGDSFAECIIPSDHVSRIISLFDGGEIGNLALGERQWRAERGETQLFGRVIDASYPKTSIIESISKVDPFALGIASEIVTDLAALEGDRTYNAIWLRSDGGDVLAGLPAATGAVTSAQIALTAEGKADLPQSKINQKYLTATLSAFGDEVALSAGDNIFRVTDAQADAAMARVAIVMGVR